RRRRRAGGPGAGPAGFYLESLREHDSARLAADIAWLDRLLNRARADAHATNPAGPAGGDPAGGTTP
ncbi:MAG: hypothetical protein ACKVWR_17220, partial [Acidimicrobiales bacterium]